MLERRQLKAFSDYISTLVFPKLSKIHNLELIDNILDDIPVPESIVVRPSRYEHGTPINNIEILSVFYMFFTKNELLMKDNVYLNLDQQVSINRKSGQVYHDSPWMIRTKSPTDKMIHVSDLLDVKQTFKYSRSFPHEYEIYCAIVTNFMDMRMPVIEISQDDYRFPGLLKQTQLTFPYNSVNISQF